VYLSSRTVFINAVNSVLGLLATPLKWQIFLLEERKFKKYKTHWSKVYILATREGNWIYTYSSAIQSSSGEAC
jgi:hypothetical protein